MRVLRLRQAAVVAAYLAGGLLVAALLLLQAERMLWGDLGLWMAT